MFSAPELCHFEPFLVFLLACCWARIRFWRLEDPTQDPWSPESTDVVGNPSVFVSLNGARGAQYKTRLFQDPIPCVSHQ